MLNSRLLQTVVHVAFEGHLFIALVALSVLGSLAVLLLAYLEGLIIPGHVLSSLAIAALGTASLWFYLHLLTSQLLEAALGRRHAQNPLMWTRTRRALTALRDRVVITWRYMVTEGSLSTLLKKTNPQLLLKPPHRISACQSRRWTPSENPALA